MDSRKHSGDTPKGQSRHRVHSGFVRSTIGLCCVVLLAFLAGCGRTPQNGSRSLSTSDSTATLTTVSPRPTPATSSTTTPPPSALPGAPNCDPRLGGSGFEPTTIFIGCATSADNLGSIHWTSWAMTNAIGTASHNINNCEPDCADGTFSTFPVQVTLSVPATLEGVLVFTVITMTPTSSRGSQESATDAACPTGSSGPCASSGPDWGFIPSSQ
jgi:hypothetical protein